MFGMGHWEILIILLVILLIFGAKRIPEMAQGLGKGIREFRSAMRDVQEEIDVNAPSPSKSGKRIEPSAAPQSAAQEPAGPAAQQSAAQEPAGSAPQQSVAQEPAGPGTVDSEPADKEAGTSRNQ
jgi:sec-independent protein translocase protein TatA